MAEKKKPVKREFSAGGVVFKKENKKLLWLLVQPKRSDSSKPINWRLAKGIIEEEESTETTAKREVEEEAGIKVKVLDNIGKTTYFYTFKGERIFKIIIFYLMQYQAETGNDVDGIEIEKSQWLPYQEAYQKLTFDSEKKILAKAKKILEEREKQQKLL
ncbi:NUDIX domain-containing protein [Patescibacteria group bacterium]|nr:NUDIX domain-containing protein [Patescibacteria group bacterium]